MRTIIGILGFAFCSNAIAENSIPVIFIEPLVSYEQSDAEIRNPAPSADSDGRLNGLGLGSRVGVHFSKNWFIGIDGRYSWLQFKDSSYGQKTDSKSWNYGPVIGLHLPMAPRIRFWGNYIVGGTVNPEKDNGIDIDYKNAKGYRLGFGYQINIYSINFEIQQLKYDSISVENSNFPLIPNAYKNSELVNNSYILSVSFPFHLNF